MKFNYEHDYPINIQNLWKSFYWEGAGKRVRGKVFFGHVCYVATTSAVEAVAEKVVKNEETSEWVSETVD